MTAEKRIDNLIERQELIIELIKDSHSREERMYKLFDKIVARYEEVLARIERLEKTVNTQFGEE